MDDRAEVRQPLLQYQHQDPTGETGAHGKAGGCRNTGANRRPLVALREAYGIAMKRGQVMPVSEGRCDYFHLILFTENRVTFIKVKRTLTEISDPKEILQNYEREIRRLARVPLNTVYTREFWVRSPRRTSFFLIDKDRILERQADGSFMTGARYLPELPKPAVPAVLPAGADPATEQAAEKG